MHTSKDLALSEPHSDSWGHDSSWRECELRRTRDEWIYGDSSGGERTASGPDDLFPLLFETGFLPDSVVVIPAVAPLLFQGAMEELDPSTGSLGGSDRREKPLLPGAFELQGRDLNPRPPGYEPPSAGSG